MNYFEFYAGDYLRDTTRLTLVDHGAYLRLLIAYYSEENPLPAELSELYVITCAVSKGDKDAVKRVAERFFPVSEDDGLRHKGRVDEEIAKAQKRIAAARQNGKKGGSPLKKSGYNEPGFLYAIQRKKGGAIKVGITKSLAPRMSQISSKVGEIIEIMTRHVTDMGSAEAAVHAHFADKLDGEWINATVQEIVPVFLSAAAQYQPIGVPIGVPIGGAQQATHSGEALHTPHATRKDQELSNPTGLEVIASANDLPTADASTRATDEAKADRCPIQRIVELYHAKLPMCRRCEKVTPARAGYIRQRWREDLQTLEAWGNFYEYVSQSAFLTGRTQGREGHPPFVADIEFLTKPASFAKIAEGKYHQ